ncbi:MAG: hypothetical protein ACLPLR_20300 [Terriglobales bacterium]
MKKLVSPLLCSAKKPQITLMHYRAFGAASEAPIGLSFLAPQECDEVSRAVDYPNDYNSR